MYYSRFNRNNLAIILLKADIPGILNRNDLQEGQILLFDKPLEWTSFQLVNKVRYILCKKMGIKKLKVGHAGTLDPLATGLMLLGTGRATKLLNQLLIQEKEYIAKIKLGETTLSYDCETEVNNTFETNHITLDLVKEKLHLFKGTIQQIPPLFSAKKINGVRAYEHARNGDDKKLDAVSVTIHELEIVQFDNPNLEIRILCSKGTYIRSFANDLGTALNSGAHLSGLVRTKIGGYYLSDAIELTEFENILNSM